jgi:hypothetical protein
VNANDWSTVPSAPAVMAVSGEFVPSGRTPYAVNDLRGGRPRAAKSSSSMPAVARTVTVAVPADPSHLRRRTLWPNRGTVQQRVEYRTNVDVHLGARVAAGLGYSESAKAA